MRRAARKRNKGQPAREPNDCALRGPGVQCRVGRGLVTLEVRWLAPTMGGDSWQRVRMCLKHVEEQNAVGRIDTEQFGPVRSAGWTGPNGD